MRCVPIISVDIEKRGDAASIQRRKAEGCGSIQKRHRNRWVRPSCLSDRSGESYRLIRMGTGWQKKAIWCWFLLTEPFEQSHSVGLIVAVAGIDRESASAPTGRVVGSPRIVRLPKLRNL